ncbi:MAG: hypothetical protein BGO82_00855 [Devosia sp. 67-54]|jgi:hypothetical protein|uniref:DUF930 domain-containing protein n=1 Tax=unclassified Devosia TaxID=196773 RepID=UPI000962A49D|nr:MULTISPECIES: DUF930 domain-containing protein [unclassified Devosia]MBN9305986.1 DUF930 domain-containing protein [Devosia sp.]OJX16334.1 MAG: hypothetical protein BGO82_00855 [Devosia sp. 67-54]
MAPSLAIDILPHPSERGLERSFGFLTSSVAHVALLMSLLYLWSARPILLPPPKPIDVQVLSETDYARVTEPSPALPFPSVQPAPLQLPRAEASIAKPEETLRQRAPSVPPPAVPSMTHATRLFATALLKEPASTEVRLTLSTLDRYERITQLCNIESTEQIRRSINGSNPDTVSAAAFAETSLANLTMTVNGGAYRSGRNWYALSFVCTVLPDLSGVADYSFKTGAAIPKDLWEEHNLNAQDDDDE